MASSSESHSNHDLNAKASTSDVVASAGYRVGNPSAWQSGYDEQISEEIRALLALISSLVAERDADAKRIYLTETNRDDWRDRALTAERLLAEARGALKPFAAAAEAYEPEEEDDRSAAWQSVFDIGDLRSARAALGAQP